MKLLNTSLRAASIAEQLGGQLIGDGEVMVTGLNEIHHVVPGDLCFVDHPKYYDKTIGSEASVILIDRIYDCPAGKALIVTPSPFAAYSQLAASLVGLPVLSFATAADFPASRNLLIGQGTSIAAGVVIGQDVQIGKDCRIEAGVVIGDRTIIGDRVHIQAACVLGGDAFYYKRTEAGYEPFISIGRVVIEEGVSLGPSCTIARGVSSDTRIGAGSKLDAQVQIGHDCKIGRHCLLAAQVGIAGNTQLGDWVIMQGQVGVAQNLLIGDGAVVLAKSGVSKSLEGGKQYFGYPAQEARSAFQDLAALRQMRRKGSA